jgi:hypothetical protein
MLVLNRHQSADQYLDEKLSALLIRFSKNDRFKLLERSEYLGSCVTGTVGELNFSMQSLPYIAFKKAT